MIRGNLISNIFFSQKYREKNNKGLPGIFVTTPGVRKFYEFILIWPIIKTKLWLWEIILLLSEFVFILTFELAVTGPISNRLNVR